MSKKLGQIQLEQLLSIHSRAKELSEKSSNTVELQFWKRKISDECRNQPLKMALLLILDTGMVSDEQRILILQEGSRTQNLFRPIEMEFNSRYGEGNPLSISDTPRVADGTGARNIRGRR